jgi:hypothetical protein
MQSMRRSLARLLFQAHLWKLGELVLHEGGVEFLQGGGAASPPIQLASPRELATTPRGLLRR